MSTPGAAMPPDRPRRGISWERQRESRIVDPRTVAEHDLPPILRTVRRLDFL